jgi:hypothetical protein
MCKALMIAQLIASIFFAAAIVVLAILEYTLDFSVFTTTKNPYPIIFMSLGATIIVIMNVLCYLHFLKISKDEFNEHMYIYPYFLIFGCFGFGTIVGIFLLKHNHNEKKSNGNGNVSYGYETMLKTAKLY